MNETPAESPAAGAAATREFYETTGWARRDGKLVDTELFGVKEDGPIRREGHVWRTDRIRAAFSSVGGKVRLVECGCGGTPAIFLTDLCAHYTAVDFAARGVEEARTRLERTGVPFDARQADICKLPFADHSFDAAYSAHVLYHIPTSAGQAAAISEMLRVVRPGGVIVLVVANPFPLLSPVRLTKRLVAATPVLRRVADKLRPPPPVPYLPKRIGWMKQQFAGKAAVEVSVYALASTWFNQRVSEQSWIGAGVWRSIVGMQKRMPGVSAYLGNYVTIVARKHPS